MPANEKRSELMERRGKLLSRIAAQRGQIAEIGSQFQTPLLLADKGMGAARYLRVHPFLLAGVVGFLVIRRPRLASLVWLGGRVWRIYRDFSSLLAKRLLQD